MTLLTVENMDVRYGGAQALKDVSLAVDAGQIVTLIGPNGAGKTTTLRAISGLVRTSNGRITFDDRVLNRLAPQRIVKLGIGHVPQGRDLFPWMTVMENLILGAYLQTRRARIRQDLETVFGHFPILNERKKQEAGTLSGGQQQMLAIARALMGRPRLLILDEPSLGLAPLLVKEIGKIIVNINREGTTVLLVEQNARLALKLAHRCYVLETGRIVEQGETEELLKGDRIKRAYLGG